MPISFEQAIATQDLKTEEIPTPEWGEGASVTVGALNAADMLKWLSEENDERGGINLAVKCWVNPDGSRIPVEKRSDAANALALKDSAVVGRIVNRCLAINGLRRKEAVEEAKNA